MEKKKPVTRKTAAKVQSRKLDLSSARLPLAIIIGAAIGGVVMYALDPVAGANRRSTFFGRLKSFGSSANTSMTEQLSGLSGIVTQFISSWFGTSSKPSLSSTSEATESEQAAARGTTTSAFAQKVAATDPDAFNHTH